MSGDVVEFGPERPRRRSGSVLVGVVALGLLVAGVVGATRHRDTEPVAEPSPSFSAGWTEYPSSPPPEPAELFVTALTVAKPANGAVVGGALPDGTPVLVASRRGIAHAFVAFAGPRHAPVLVGFCPSTRTFQDASGTYRYDETGTPAQPGTSLTELHSRTDPADATRVQVSLGSTESFVRGPGFPATPRCPTGLVLPPIPPESRSLAAAARGYARLVGRYVVTLETRRFCDGTAPDACRDGAWEEFAPDASLPPNDLASSYTYEGTFLVRTFPTTGSLSVVRLDARLVHRDGVGVRAVRGVAVSTEVRHGVTRLRFVPRAIGGKDGAASDYLLRDDMRCYLGLGVTGLGRPSGTLDVFTRYVREEAKDVPLWLVLDANDRVIRAAVEGRRSDLG